MRTPEPRYLSQFALGLGQRRLFLIKLGLGGIQLHPLGLHHPVDPPINLDEGEEPSVRHACNAPMDTMARCWAGCGTSMARTHMQSDLAASDTLPMMSGWKSDIRQYWPIFLSTRSEMLSLSKCTRVLMKLDSPVEGHIFVWFWVLFTSQEMLRLGRLQCACQATSWQCHENVSSPKRAALTRD